MTKIDVIYEIHHSEYASYRIVPNPDGEPGSGYKSGAMLQWKDKGQTEWQGSDFICPAALGPLSIALAEAAKDVEDPLP